MMKIVMIAVLIGACAVQQDVSSTAQQICQDDPDTCPGGHPLTPQQMRVLTDGYATQSAGGASPINESWSACSTHYCATRWEFSWGVIVTACVDDGGGPVCSSISCTTGPNCTP